LIISVALAAPPVALGIGAASCPEVITDGGFEQNGVGWTQQPSPPLPSGMSLIDSFYPHTGTLGAYLAGRSGANDLLSQQVTLAAGADSITLDLWWALDTQETGGAFDYLYVALYNASGALIAPLLTVDNTTAENWVWANPSFDLTSYAGQTVTVRFTATNDNANPTAFFIDDVSITACTSVATETASPSPTPTSTCTPTASPSPMPTWTATLTPAVSPSPTPTATPVATSSATATSTSTLTATSSVTPTPTPTITPAETPTGTATSTLSSWRYRSYLPLVLRDWR